MGTFTEPGPLGFGFDGQSGSTMVVSVRPDSQAGRHGQVPVGSGLLTISAGGTQHNVEGMPYLDVLAILKQGVRPVTMSFRLPSEPPAPAAPMDSVPAPPPPAAMDDAPPPPPSLPPQLPQVRATVKKPCW